MRKKSGDPVDRHVGQRVRMQRMLLGMSQEKLAAAIGLTFQQVQKYEKGTNRIAASRLQQIAQVLKVPVAFFYEGVPNLILTKGDEPDPLQEQGQTSQGIKLARAFNAIDPTWRTTVVEIAEHLAALSDHPVTRAAKVA